MTMRLAILILMLCCNCTLASELPREIVVRPGAEVIGADSFLCKAMDNPTLGHARLRVWIRGVEKLADPNTQIAAIDFLKEAFHSAKSVRLKNIHYSFGFRITADVWVDGMLLSKRMTARGMATDIDQKPAGDIQLAGSQDAQPLWMIPRPVDRPSRPVVHLQQIKVGDLFKKPVDLRAITPQTTFSEAIDILSRAIEPRLPLIVLWKDLELNTNIQQDTEVGISGLTTIPLGYALELILRSAAGSGPKPLIVIEGGVLTLGSQSTLRKQSQNKVYSIQDLMNPQNLDLEYGSSNGYGNSGLGLGDMGTGR
ncbi:MAG: hypothetical protein ABFD91_15650 [Anaerohalosphaeraceae bacterium]